ncbi:MAG: ribosome biogenesis GTPase Der [Ruminococcaceae bacterium]|nr:ribosome biogenesis GTPase Der [Oscillospiraceae bacterium]
MSTPVVAIVGRPNVGKSTLFNKLTGKRISIVEDTPGVTRDRIYHEAEWRGRHIMLVDTGGIEPRTDNMMLRYMRRQAETAIETADVIVFLTDVTVGMLDEDRQIASLLMKSGKPVILAVNKVDRVGMPPMEFYEFYQLGFKDDPIAVSALHGSGTGDLLDAILGYCPEEGEEEGELDESIRVAVIGKPNAGKSSIINRILGHDRLIVSEVAGTTRDAIDTAVENEFGNYVFIDTAGIRRQSKVEDPVEKYSVLRAKLAVDRADVCVIMIDAVQGVTEQDERIAGIAHEAGKPSVICINKWDLIEKDNNTVKEFTEKVYQAFSYMTYAEVLYLSAKTGQRVERLYEMINRAYEQSKLRITTGILNDLLNDATTRVQPPSDKGRYLKIYYMTQIGIQPPTFVVFCNSAELFHFSYRRYLENCLRDVFGFKGTPIKIIIRERGEDPS